VLPSAKSHLITKTSFKTAMTPKKFQIFVSSTYSDLADVRRGVIESIQRLNHFPVGMEQFSADDDEQWEIIQETIQQTDYYVCLIGHRYGSIGNDGLSYTEMEWDYAKQLGIPIMSFVRERSTATTPEQRDSDPAFTQKLDAFIAKATAAKMVDFWTDLKDLNVKVVTALYKSFSRKPRPGWIRTESERVSEEMAKMIEENRSLHNQLEKLAAEATGAHPSFRISMNGGKELILHTVPRSELKLKNAPKLNPIEWDSIPAEIKQFTTRVKIEQYNSELPSSSQLADIYKRINFVEVAKQTSSPLSIILSNVGSAKAREVTIDIVFPDTVLVMEKDEFEQMEVPKFKLPSNPLEAAKKRFEESQKPKTTLDLLGAIRESGNFANLATPSFTHHSLMKHVDFDNSRSFSVEKNHVSIWFKDLMHSRQRTIDDLVIIPLKPGSTSEIEISIICEEIPKPQKEIIRLEVIEKGQASPPTTHAKQS
jgi:hypothetical protein